jgi:hypothetical protein
VSEKILSKLEALSYLPRGSSIHYVEPNYDECKNLVDSHEALREERDTFRDAVAWMEKETRAMESFAEQLTTLREESNAKQLAVDSLVKQLDAMQARHDSERVSNRNLEAIAVKAVANAGKAYDIGQQLVAECDALREENGRLKERVRALTPTDYGFTREEIAAAERDMALTAWAEWLETLPPEVELRSEQERDLYEKALRPKGS